MFNLIKRLLGIKTKNRHNRHENHVVRRNNNTPHRRSWGR